MTNVCIIQASRRGPHGGGVQMAFRQAVDAATAADLEAIEARAWQDFYAAAPDALVQAFGLRAGCEAGADYMFSRIPFVLFNRAVNLGVSAPATQEQLDRLLALSAAAGAPRFTVHVHDHAQPAQLEDWLAARGFADSGGWERVWRDASPLVATEASDDPAAQRGEVEVVDLPLAQAWIDFLYSLYRLPVEPWLMALVGRPGWHHYRLVREGRIVAVRSQFIDSTGGAWMGVEAPVPGAMAPSFDDDAVLCRAMVADGLRLGVRRFVADIEVPDAQGASPAYAHFAALGFACPYLRRHYTFTAS